MEPDQGVNTLRKNLEFWGGLVSAVYLIGMAVVVYFKFDNLITLDLNEIGDFLAGVFGPVAILWLVLGFLQQGRELKISTAALQLQGHELKESVKQLERQAATSEERFKLEREARLEQINLHRKMMRPILDVQCPKIIRDSSGFTLNLVVVNNGARVIDFQVFNLAGENRQKLQGLGVYGEGQVTIFDSTLIFNGQNELLEFEATYTERDSELGSTRFSGRVSTNKYGVCSLALSSKA